MELTFYSMAELDEFAEVWTRGRIACAAALREGVPSGRKSIGELTVDITADPGRLKDMADAIARDLRGQDGRPVTAEGAAIPEGDGPATDKDSQEPAGAGAGESPSTDPAPEGAPKRKRRTKAQIAADEAAAKTASVAPADKAAPDAGTIIDKGDGTAVFADGKGGEVGRAGPPATETVTTELHPDVLALAATIDGNDSLAHMNEARAFIAKHEFPAYTETFKLTGLPSAIAGYTPEQVALHRAAMQWLTAQAGAK